MCNEKGYAFIDQSDIGLHHISKDGIHLNFKGHTILKMNILKCFYSFNPYMCDFLDLYEQFLWLRGGDSSIQQNHLNLDITLSIEGTSEISDTMNIDRNPLSISISNSDIISNYVFDDSNPYANEFFPAH